MLTQNKIHENVEQNGKAIKMLFSLQQFQKLVLILNMLNVASFPHLTDESFFSKFSFLMNLCFIPHLGLTPHFHLLVMPPEHFVCWVELCSVIHSRCTHCMAFSGLGI